MTDIRGHRNGRLLILDCNPVNARVVLCRCDCGNEIFAPRDSVRGNNHRKRSCGCLRQERYQQLRDARGKKRGPNKNKAKPRTMRPLATKGTYNSWSSMKGRCNNKNWANVYKNYGGRGIKHCKKWTTFDGFFEDMGNRPEGTTIDRIDVNGNYCKANCRWSTRHEQRVNQRSSTKLQAENKRLLRKIKKLEKELSSIKSKSMA